MKFIQKITTYNVPIKKSSQDRYFQAVDTKILPNKVEDISDEHFSYTLSNSTNAVFTFNSTNRANYVRIESSLFKGKTVSYWFLVDVSDIESEVGTRYNAFLDVAATFGQDLFNQLDGKEIEIERFHGERYVPSVSDPNLYVINHQHHSLLNSDFKVGDTKGQEVKAVGYTDERVHDHRLKKIVFNHTVGTDKHGIEDYAETNGDYTAKTFNDEECAIWENYNTDKKNKKRHYLYAVVSGPSFRKYIKGNAQEPTDENPFGKFNETINSFVTTSGTSKNFLDEFLKADNHPMYGDFYILPVINNPKRSISDPEDTSHKILYYGNTIDWFQALPEGIVLSINAVPSPMEYGTMTSDSNGNFEGICIDTINMPTTNNTGLVNVRNIYILPIATYKRKHFIEHITKDNIAKALGVEPVIKKGVTEDNLHIGMINQDISMAEFMLDGNTIPLDIYSFYGTSDLSGDIISVDQSLGGNGSVIGVTLSRNQYQMLNMVNDVSFFTSQSATYLQQNRNSIATQRKRVDLDTEMQIKQNTINRRSQWSGSPTGALLSIFNPMSWNVESTLSEMPDVIRDVGANKKQEIDAHIQDLQSTPSIVNMAKENTLNIFNYKHDDGFDNTYVLKLTIPNKILLSKIKMYYKRFGTLANGVYAFNFSKMLTNMERYNFIKINSVKDYLTTSDAIDIDIVEEFDKELKAGIRLHHNSVIDYNARNVEKNISNEL